MIVSFSRARTAPSGFENRPRCSYSIMFDRCTGGVVRGSTALWIQVMARVRSLSTLLSS